MQEVIVEMDMEETMDMKEAIAVIPNNINMLFHVVRN